MSVFRLPSSCRLILALSLVLLPAAPVAARMVTTSPPGYRDAFAALESGSLSTAQGVMARGGDPVLNKVLRGALMARPGNDYSFDDLAGFVTDNPDWPGLNGILMIAEQKIPSSATPDQIVNWFTAHPPLTAPGFVRFTDALDALGQGTKAAGYVRGRWVTRDFSSDELAAFYARYAPVLTSREHNARLDRLLWANNITAAQAMYSYVDSGQRALAEARFSLANQLSNAEGLIAQVPSSLKNDPGLLYERLRWRRKNNMDEAALEILKHTPEHLGQPDKWWDERHVMIRRVMEQRDFNLAYRLASDHGVDSGFDFTQAEFLAGWLALRFLKRADLAQKHFHALFENASTPMTRARGAYWLGRAYEALGDKREAEQSYETAAALSMTYHGQLALTRLYAQPEIKALPEPPIPANVRLRFFARDVVQAAERLLKIGQADRARLFFKAATEAAEQRYEYALLMDLAYKLQRPDWAITAAKAANQKNIIVGSGAFPVLSIHIPTPPDPAFTHALIRQESLFNSSVGSPAGARGLMQLMPGTAKGVAKKLGMAYEPERLAESSYNLRLGTTYAQEQLDNFDGSFILALAGYNAGPRRVREWIEQNGDPRTSRIDPIDWIEMIPIYETRNYIQRILENYQVYRARLRGGQAPLTLLQDLKR